MSDSILIISIFSLALGPWQYQCIDFESIISYLALEVPTLVNTRDVRYPAKPNRSYTPRESSMVLSYDLLEKSKLGGSVAVQLPYDLLTLGNIEYTTDAIGLKAA